MLNSFLRGEQMTGLKIVFFTVFLLLASLQLISQVTYEVSGAGIAAVNGTYTRVGSSPNSDDLWQNENGVYLFDWQNTADWFFGNNYDLYSSDDQYYEGWGTTPDVVSNWWDLSTWSTITFSVEIAQSEEPPTLTTTSISTFDATSATMGGNISDDGGAAIDERGVVYSSTDTTPEINETGVTKNTNGSGTGNFSESIWGLSPNTTYYVQAYATNSAGTSYGGVQSFTTLQRGLWTGATNTDWHTGANWDDGNVPDSSVNVTIPTGCTNYPIIDANAACQNITIQNGGSAQISTTFILNVTGTFTLEDNSNFTNHGTLQFGGDDCHLNDDRTVRYSLGNITVD
jgi:hypothetical protein